MWNVLGDWSQGVNISKSAAFMKCSRAVVVKLFKDWPVSQKLGLNVQFAVVINK